MNLATLLDCHATQFQIEPKFLFSEILDLPSITQEQLFSELLDREAQRELEDENDIINWSEELRGRFGSRLTALWNR